MEEGRHLCTGGCSAAPYKLKHSVKIRMVMDRLGPEIHTVFVTSRGRDSHAFKASQDRDLQGMKTG